MMPVWRSRSLRLHPVARGKRGAAQHRFAMLVAHRLRARIAVFVDEHRHQANRKALGEIVDHIFPRGQIDLESFALLIRQFGNTITPSKSSPAQARIWSNRVASLRPERSVG